MKHDQRGSFSDQDGLGRDAEEEAEFSPRIPEW
jgi:hypothetical protein